MIRLRKLAGARFERPGTVAAEILSREINGDGDSNPLPSTPEAQMKARKIAAKPNPPKSIWRNAAPS